MTTSKSTQHIVRKRQVIKLGGSMLDELSDTFFQCVKKLQQDGIQVIIVHGGGPSINQELADRGVTSSVVNGFRVTSAEAIGIVQSIMIGQVNPSLVHRFNQEGVKAVGLSGYDANLFTCDLLDFDTYGYVGKIKSVETEILDTLLDAGITPVISCVGKTESGEPLNVNADTVASRIALAVEAESLLLVTDTSGIRIQDQPQTEVEPQAIYGWIKTEDIYGGMIPKVMAAIDCLEAGIPSVKIVCQKLNGTVITNEGAIA
ncbi:MULTISPECIES: acetylglutamate kinase [Sporosarcina]|uniref:acetylglutamate kinase n=1 Tax=Sporosarcina TaxID=1569 RepID=UPI000A17D1E4|nr:MULTISPECIES: acetylglutamate kinase [Sporosarcina]ARK20760.1 acetyl-L-glutamate 5-phosphotransferase [Sporosarcina ureae]PIC74957.1 acetylglutamate kinase [Sporosarcina sp. P17b]